MPKPLAMIVEDDPQLNKVFHLSLLPSFEVEAVLDGDRALARLQEVLPDLIVLDLNLPGVSGRTVLETIRADERLARIPIIIATADALQADYVRSDSDVILLKPISPMQLREIAERLYAR